MYIGDFSQESQEMQEESVYQIKFTYPSTPKSVPLTNAIRKGNSIAFFFRTVPNAEELARLIKYAEGDFVNPCPHFTKTKGVHRKIYQKVNNKWVEVE